MASNKGIASYCIKPERDFVSKSPKAVAPIRSLDPLLFVNLESTDPATPWQVHMVMILPVLSPKDLQPFS